MSEVFGLKAEVNMKSRFILFSALCLVVFIASVSHAQNLMMGLLTSS